MRIIDGSGEIRLCYENGMFSMDKWRTYMDKVYPQARVLVEEDAASYDFNREILPVLNAVWVDPVKFQRMHDSFRKACENLNERIRDCLHAELDADVVLYLGLCNGAGWAETVGGKPVVLLGIEKIIELDWTDEASMIGLIYHELGHLWHFGARSAETIFETPSERGLWQLYTEGVAMTAEQLLCRDDGFYHQNRDGWLDWCRENRGRLFREYARRIDAGESVQDFFGDWCSYDGHSDVGYYLGAELVREAMKTRSMDEILNLPLTDVKKLLDQCTK